MVVRARTKKGRRELGALGRAQAQLASVVSGVREAVRGGTRWLERQTADAQLTARMRAAKTLQDVAMQLRRAQKAIAPPPSKRRRRARATPKGKVATVDAVPPAKPSAAELAA